MGPPREFVNATANIGNDPGHKAVIITSTGDEFLAEKPTLTLRYSRVVLTRQLKRLIQHMLGYGLGVEGLALVDAALQGC